jgi:hypothetical protein
MKKNILLLFFLLISANHLLATPQFSMLTGNKCANCHFNSLGSGIRNDLGFYAIKDVGLINPDDIGIGKFHEKYGQENSLFDRKLFYGFDFRFQTAMLGDPEHPVRKYFGMQASPYLVLIPTEWLTIGGFYNIFYDVYKHFPAQKPWSAYINIQPDLLYPSLKVGFFEPPIGMRYDDHSLLISQIAGGGAILNQFIPPDYAEYGAEINYDGLKWLTLTAGIFDSKSMSQEVINISQGAIPLINQNNLSSAIRISLWQRFFENNLNLNLGASYFKNNDFNIIAIFLNAGLTDKISLLTELMLTDKTGYRQSKNYLIELSYSVLEPLLLYGRIERAITDENEFIEGQVQKVKFTTNQAVIGVQVFPLPFIELRPEYRMFDRLWVPGYETQYAVQFHAFF